MLAELNAHQSRPSQPAEVVGVVFPAKPEATQSLYQRCKSSADFVLAAILLVLFSPVILVFAALVRVTSAGPAFYRQTRLGLNGRPFTIIKLRTMRHNCEKVGGVKWSPKKDIRVTRLGKFMWATHVDELPQLVNVLKGEMSLVGPRPERPEIIPTLEVAIPEYRERLAVKPGVTGLAQVHLPPDVDINSVRMKVVFDRHYISNVSLPLDLGLMLCTALKMFGVPSRKLARMIGLTEPDQAGTNPTSDVTN